MTVSVYAGHGDVYQVVPGAPSRPRSGRTNQATGWTLVGGHARASSHRCAIAVISNGLPGLRGGKGGAFGRRSSFAVSPVASVTKPCQISAAPCASVMHHASSILAAAVVVASATLAQAQGAAPLPAKPEMIQSCPGLWRHEPPFLQNAALRLAALERDQARLTYVGHSTFRSARNSCASPPTTMIM